MDFKIESFPNSRSHELHTDYIKNNFPNIPGLYCQLKLKVYRLKKITVEEDLTQLKFPGFVLCESSFPSPFLCNSKIHQGTKQCATLSLAVFSKECDKNKGEKYRDKQYE